ncbi:MAG: hypothetical protein KFF50_02640 [Desulfatitalea sp.]|nr:hypothetical protein [Desulfatitalea sp.]
MLVSEPGLYKLTFRSRQPEAKNLKRWITHIIVPEIRRTGGFLYATADMTDELILIIRLTVPPLVATFAGTQTVAQPATKEP